MKHILNNLTDEEKNSIREQYTGGKKIMIENFNKLVNSTLGDSKPLMEEDVKFKPGDKIGTAQLEIGEDYYFDVIYKGKKVSVVVMELQGTNNPGTNDLTQKYLTLNNQYYFKLQYEGDYRGLVKGGLYYYTPNNEGPGYGIYKPNSSVSTTYYLERKLKKTTETLSNKPGKGPKKGNAYLEMGREYFFSVVEDNKRAGKVAMSVQSSPDDDHYELVATGKSEYPRLKDGKYTYGSGIFTIPDASYHLALAI